MLHNDNRAHVTTLALFIGTCIGFYLTCKTLENIRSSRQYLDKKLRLAVREERYEDAAIIRDQLKTIQK